METLMIAMLMTLMLVIIAAGSVAYCIAVGKKAKRASARTEALSDALNNYERRIEELEERVIDLREKALENGSQSVTEDERKAEAQYEEMHKYQLQDYGLRFGGVSTNEN